MSSIFTLTPSDLAALLSSKVCHDIISPVGAINNGLELLDEGGADEAAMDLVKTSARNASARLQFARIAYGAAGSAGVQIDTGDAEGVAREYIRGEKPEFTWTGERAFLPKNKVKLLLNLILIANGSIPRGGTLDVTLENLEESPVLRIAVAGKMLRVSPKFDELYTAMKYGAPLDEPIDAHSVQAYYTLLLANEAGMTIDIDENADRIIFTAS
ncbi:histidine phosphotransferase family protein [Oricola sp.]|uniref:histidine phosphotransferase ChpT n=1 Tax=Oricola sp. TaxID=1979950 RepID=UPI0025D90ED3|nr:histidine phosphotransferase family protein [Oricola sp.]MCI5074434.1 histidine phosphotransferase family protein [Oricola sp.]